MAETSLHRVRGQAGPFRPGTTTRESSVAERLQPYVGKNHTSRRFRADVGIFPTPHRAMGRLTKGNHTGHVWDRTFAFAASCGASEGGAAAFAPACPPDDAAWHYIPDPGRPAARFVCGGRGPGRAGRPARPDRQPYQLAHRGASQGNPAAAGTAAP